MGLINKSYLLTLNQRVPGSSPGAPTNKINYLSKICTAVKSEKKHLVAHR